LWSPDTADETVPGLLRGRDRMYMQSLPADVAVRRMEISFSKQNGDRAAASCCSSRSPAGWTALSAMRSERLGGARRDSDSENEPLPG
jgi:hypothetical protein